MSKVFYDHLIVFEEVDVLIKSSSSSREEKEELWSIVDEMVHHSVMNIILDSLPRKYHSEFLEKFTVRPFDDGLILYLNMRTNKDVEKEIKEKVKEIEASIIKDLKKN